MHCYEFQSGFAPLLVSMPHIGSFIPEDIRSAMSPAGRMVSDTDWDLDLLYDFLVDQGAHVVRANYSRYVIDLNRDPDNRPLYHGIQHPGLVPTHTFDDVPLYRSGKEPTEDDVRCRRNRYWRPYHDRVGAALSEIRARHGIAVLFDCHSIKSVVPRYSADYLPDFSVGTADGTSCASDLRAAIEETMKGTRRYSLAIDGLFKGGYITRQYGRPDMGQHAFQLELSQATYMREGQTPIFDAALASSVRPILRRMIEGVLSWADAARARTA